MPQVLNRSVTKVHTHKETGGVVFERVSELTDGAIYVGRPTKWGNPFEIDEENGQTREIVIEHYRVWLMTQPDLLVQLGQLRGHDLVCWCAPQACHADILLKLANE